MDSLPLFHKTIPSVGSRVCKIRSGKMSVDQFGVSGIYFLFQGDEIIYVGQSTDLASRIKTWIQSQEMPFDGFSYKLMPAEKLARAESRFIRLLRPRYNKVHNPAYRYIDKPFSLMKPKELADYYKNVCVDLNPVPLELISDSYGLEGLAVGWWSNGTSPKAFNVLWARPKRPSDDGRGRDSIFNEAYQSIENALGVLKNVHPVVRKMVREGKSIDQISEKLSFRPAVVTPFVKQVINPEVHWWKFVEV